MVRLRMMLVGLWIDSRLWSTWCICYAILFDQMLRRFTALGYGKILFRWCVLILKTLCRLPVMHCLGRCSLAGQHSFTATQLILLSPGLRDLSACLTVYNHVKMFTLLLFAALSRLSDVTTGLRLCCHWRTRHPLGKFRNLSRQCCHHTPNDCLPAL